MWAWIQEILDRRETERERARQHELDLRVCRSCEILQNELARYRERERELYNTVVNLPQRAPEEGPYRTQVEIPVRKSWALKRQELEARERRKIEPVKVQDLDKELDEVRNAK